jgi:hypothetical protein
MLSFFRKRKKLSETVWPKPEEEYPRGLSIPPIEPKTLKDFVSEPVNITPTREGVIYRPGDSSKKRAMNIFEALNYEVDKVEIIQLAEYLEMYMRWDKGLPQKPNEECFFTFDHSKKTTGDKNAEANEADKDDEGCAREARQVSEEDGTGAENSL